MTDGQPAGAPAAPWYELGGAKAAEPTERLRALEDTLRATLNLLEDMHEERHELEVTQRALLNILDDVEVERTRVEAARLKLETANQSLWARSQQLAALASELTVAELRERRRLAQTLHDGLQQTLISVKMRLEMVLRQKDSSAWAEIARAAELVAEAIKASRLLTTDLSPRVLYESGLVPAFKSLVHWMWERHQLRVDLRVRGQVQQPEHATAALLYQATRELLVNVVKHAEVKAAAVEVQQHGHTIHITVSDDGLGFDPSSLRTEDGSYRGLGLFSIRERLDLLGGTMRIDSARGSGSRVTMTAPLPLIARPDEGAADVTPAAPGGFAPDRGGVAATGKTKIRIVLVDDHAVVRQGVAYLIGREQDMELVGEAADGETAVATIQAVHPHVVLMDVSLPGLSGIEATRVVHSLMPDVRIIGWSMFDDPEPAREIRDAGAVAFLTKSSGSESLLSTIRACLIPRGHDAS